MPRQQGRVTPGFEAPISAPPRLPREAFSGVLICAVTVAGGPQLNREIMLTSTAYDLAISLRVNLHPQRLLHSTMRGAPPASPSAQGNLHPTPPPLFNGPRSSRCVLFAPQFAEPLRDETFLSEQSHQGDREG